MMSATSRLRMKNLQKLMVGHSVHVILWSGCNVSINYAEKVYITAKAIETMD